MPPFRLLLVHGTGARDAEWTQPERSTLRRHLELAFGNQVSFARLRWSGRNTYQARLDGARRLRKRVLKTARVGCVPILVGHSHGGSLIAHALANDPVLCEQVGGVVFLSTPFVHARPLPLGRHLPKGPALFAGALCALAIVLGGIFLLAAMGWLEKSNWVLSAIAYVLPYAGLLTWWTVYQAVGRFLGVSDGVVTKRTQESLAALIGQLDLGSLESFGLNRKALVIRSTADEAASGLAAAQLVGRIAGDLPALTWRLPQWLWQKLRGRIRFDSNEPPRWAVWAFFLTMFFFFLGFTIRGAAWLSDWPMLRLLDTKIGATGSSVFEALFTALVWVGIGVILFLLATVPLLAIGIPFKFVGLLLYGLRGWPVFQALYVELSIEPAPPGDWRILQLDSRHFDVEVQRAREQRLQQELALVTQSGSADLERARELVVANFHESVAESQRETTLAHSLVYDDPRTHRAIEEWLRQLST